MKKMDKKGFTLVELLAVIAILAILILLVTPNILSMFNEGKESIFVQQAQRVLEATNTKFMSASLKGPGSYTFSNLKEGDNQLANTTNLNLTNDTINYCVKVSAEGKITYLHVSDNTYSILLDTADIKIDDISKTDSDGNYTNLKTNDSTNSSNGYSAVAKDTTSICK